MERALSWNEFDTSRPLTWAFLGGTAAAFLAIGAYYLRMERRGPIPVVDP